MTSSWEEHIIDRRVSTATASKVIALGALDERERQVYDLCQTPVLSMLNANPKIVNCC